MTRRKRVEAAAPNPYESQNAQANVSLIQQYAESHSGQLTLYTNNTNGYLELKFTLADRPENWYLNPGAAEISQSQAKVKPVHFLSGLLRNGSLLGIPDTDLAAVEPAAPPRKRQAIASAGASGKPISKPLTEEPSPTNQVLGLSKAQQKEFPKYVKEWESLVPNVENILKHNMRMIHKHSPRRGLSFTANSAKHIVYYYPKIKSLKRISLNIRPDYKLTEHDCKVTAKDAIEYFFSRGVIPAFNAPVRSTMQGFTCPRSKASKDGSVTISAYSSPRFGADTMTLSFQLQGRYAKFSKKIKLDPIAAPDEDKLRRDNLLRSLINLYKEETKEDSKLAEWNKLSPKGLVDKLIEIAVEQELIQISGQQRSKKKRRIEPQLPVPMSTMAAPENTFAPPMSTMAAPENTFAPPMPTMKSLEDIFGSPMPTIGSLEDLFGPPISPLAAPAQAAADPWQNLPMDLAEPATAAGCPWLSNPSKVERLATAAPISRKRAREREDDIAAELLAAPIDEEQLGDELDLLLEIPELEEEIDAVITALGDLDEPPKAPTPVKVASNPSSLWFDISQLRKRPRAATATTDDSMEDENIVDDKRTRSKT